MHYGTKVSMPDKLRWKERFPLQLSHWKHSRREGWILHGGLQLGLKRVIEQDIRFMYEEMFMHRSLVRWTYRLENSSNVDIWIATQLLSATEKWQLSFSLIQLVDWCRYVGRVWYYLLYNTHEEPNRSKIDTVQWKEVPPTSLQCSIITMQ